ncbi:MAG: diacylglycerol kinase [Gammaproteobacteria bacterium]|nr:diacylglycerol kinase [Gammaproteobacteria bacterium]
MSGDESLTSLKADRNGARRLLRATRCSIAGLRAAWTHEWAFRIECLAAAVLAPVALWLGRSGVERALLIGSCVLVLIVELLNSGVEAAVDRIGTEYHPLAGRAKDLGSAAVMGALALAGIVWVLVVWDRFAGA